MVLTLTLTQPVQLSPAQRRVPRSSAVNPVQSARTHKSASKTKVKRSSVQSTSNSHKSSADDAVKYTAAQTDVVTILHTIERIIKRAYELYSAQGSIVNVDRMPLIYILDAYDAVVQNTADMTVYNILMQMSADTSISNWYDKLYALQCTVQAGHNYLYDNGHRYYNMDSSVLYDPQYNALQSDITDLVYSKLMHTVDSTKLLDAGESKQLEPADQTDIKLVFDAWYTLYKQHVVAKHAAKHNAQQAATHYARTLLLVHYTKWLNTSRSNTHVRRCKKQADAQYNTQLKHSALRAWCAHLNKYGQTERLCTQNDTVYNTTITNACFTHWATRAQYHLVEQRLMYKAKQYHDNKLKHRALHCYKCLLHNANKHKTHRMNLQVCRYKHNSRLLQQAYKQWQQHCTQHKQYKALRSKCGQSANKQLLRSTMQRWRFIRHKQKQLTPLLTAYTQRHNAAVLRNSLRTWLTQKRAQQRAVQLSQHAHTKAKQQHCFRKLKRHMQHMKQARLQAERRYNDIQQTLLHNAFYIFVDNIRTQQSQRQREAIESNYTELLTSTSELYCTTTTLKHSFQCWRLVFVQRMYTRYQATTVNKQHNQTVLRNVFSEWILLQRVQRFYKRQQLNYAIRQWLQYNEYNQQLQQLHHTFQQLFYIKQWQQAVLQQKKVVFMRKLVAVNALKRNVKQHKFAELHNTVADNLYEHNMLQVYYRHIVQVHKRIQYDNTLKAAADNQYQHSANKRLYYVFAFNAHSVNQAQHAVVHMLAYRQQQYVAAGLSALYHDKQRKLRIQHLTNKQQQYHSAAITRNVLGFWRRKYECFVLLRRTVHNMQKHAVLQQWMQHTAAVAERVNTMTQLAVQRNNSLLTSQAYNHIKYTYLLQRRAATLVLYVNRAWWYWLQQHCFNQLKLSVAKHKQRSQQLRVFKYKVLLHRQVECIRVWHAAVQREKQIQQLEAVASSELHTATQLSALRYWHRSARRATALKQAFYQLQERHETYIRRDAIRTMRRYLKQFELAYQFSRRHNTSKQQHALNKWLHAYRSMATLHTKSDTLLKQTTLTYKRQILLYWRSLQQVRSQNQHKLAQASSVCNKLLRQQVVSHWMVYARLQHFVIQHSKQDNVELYSGAMMLWYDTFRQLQLLRTAETYCTVKQQKQVVAALLHNVEHSKVQQHKQQVVVQKFDRIQLAHTFTRWHEYYVYARAIEVDAQQYYEHRTMRQFVTALYDRLTVHRNQQAIRTLCNQHTAKETFHIWLQHTSQSAAVDRLSSAQFYFTHWRTQYRHNQYVARVKYATLQHCMQTWREQYNIVNRDNIITEYSVQIYTMRLSKQSWSVWKSELKSKKRLEHKVQRQATLTQRRAKRAVLQQLHSNVLHRHAYAALLAQAHTFNAAVQTNKAKYYLLLWNYEYKYKHVIERLCNDAAQYYFQRNVPTIQYYLNHWVRQHKSVKLYSARFEAVQHKLVQQSNRYYFTKWLQHYRFLSQKRNLAQFTAAVKQILLHDALITWRQCMYDNLQDERQCKQLQVALYRRNTLPAQQCRMSIVQHMLQISTKHGHTHSVQHFCMTQFKRYLQHRKYIQTLNEQSAVHYTRLVERHAFTVWRYKLHQIYQQRRVEAFREQHCLQRGVNALIANILQNELRAKQVEYSVQYWKYHTVRQVYNIIVCVYRNKHAIQDRFSYLLLQRYFHTMHQQYQYNQMLRRQTGLCDKHYATTLYTAALAVWKLQYAVVSEHIADVESQVGFAQLQLNSSRLRSVMQHWLALTQRKVQRRQHCDAVEMVVETIWLKNVFLQWRRTIVSEREQRNKYLMYQTFYSWKYQCQIRVHTVQSQTL